MSGGMCRWLFTMCWNAEGAEYWKNESGAVGRPAFGLRERQHLQPFGGDMRHGNRT